MTHKDKSLNKAKKIGFGPYGGKRFDELKGKERAKAIQEARDRMNNTTGYTNNIEKIIKLRKHD